MDVVGEEGGAPRARGRAAPEIEENPIAGEAARAATATQRIGSAGRVDHGAAEIAAAAHRALDAEPRPPLAAGLEIPGGRRGGVAGVPAAARAYAARPAPAEPAGLAQPPRQAA